METLIGHDPQLRRFFEKEPGPWCIEPDYMYWQDEKTGYLCAALRMTDTILCINGYVGVPPSHPANQMEQGDLDILLDVHGGITYYSHGLHFERCPAEFKDESWLFLGFDTGHYLDYYPYKYPAELESLIIHFADQRKLTGTYRSMEYVRMEVMSLVKQLHNMVTTTPHQPSSAQSACDNPHR